MPSFTQKNTNSFTVSLPSFLNLRGVGINISDHSVKMLEFVNDGGQLAVGRYDKKAIPSGAVSDGSVQVRSKVTDVLSELSHEHDLSFVRLSIPEENGYTFNLKVPPVERSNLREAVSLRLDEEIPIPADTAVFDFDITEKRANGGWFLAVSALPQEIAGEYMQICREADLKPLSFEIEAQTIARAVVDSQDESAVMIIDIGKSRTGLFIANAGTVEYTSTLSIGGDHLTQAVAEATGRDIEEAEQYKQERGFVRNAETETEFQALQSASEEFVEEAVRRFRYWYSNPQETVRESREISKALLVGGNASVPGLDDHISAQLDVPVKVANVWKNAFDINTRVPEIDFRHSLTYTSAIGLALSQEF